MIRPHFAAFLLCPVVLGSLSAERSSPSAAAVTVRLYNNLAQAPAVEIDRATAEASEIFARIGVRLEWLDCGDAPPDARCNSVSGNAVLNLRLMPPEMQPPGGLPRGIFGFALMSTDGGFASTANIYFERVSEIADGRKFRRGVVLGAMMAHELGHLLLGVRSHSKKGLMTLPWGPKVLLAADRGMLGFAKREGARIRRAMQARTGATGQSSKAGL